MQLFKGGRAEGFIKAIAPSLRKNRILDWVPYNMVPVIAPPP